MEITSSEAEKSNEANIKQLTSILAHDLKNPINTIIGFTGLIEMMLENEQNENIKSYLNIIRQEAEHSLDMINALFSYCSSKKIDYDVDDKEFIEDIIKNSKKEHEKICVEN